MNLSQQEFHPLSIIRAGGSLIKFLPYALIVLFSVSLWAAAADQPTGKGQKVFDPKALPQKFRAARVEDRQQAARELTQMVIHHHVSDLKKDPTLVPALNQSLEMESDDEARQQVLNALAELRDPRSVPAIEKIAKISKDRHSRRAALRGLAVIKGRESIPVLKEALEKDPDVLVRFTAAQQLGEVGDASGYGFAMEYLHSEHPSAHQYAAEVLGAIGDSRAIPALQKTLDAESAQGYLIHAAIEDIRLRQLSSDAAKLAKLKTALYAGQFGASWATERLAGMKSKAAVQILLDAARLPKDKYGTPAYIAQHEADTALVYLFLDGSEERYQKLQAMRQTGVALDPPQ